MDNLLDYSRFYRNKGLSCIPIKNGEKKPAIVWESYQDNPPTSDNLIAWFSHKTVHSSNMAVVLGRTIALDFDDPAYYKIFFSDSPENLAKTTWVCQTPRGGFHVYFQCDKEVKSEELKGKVELKGKGRYVLVSPSRVEDKSYYFFTNIENTDIAKISDMEVEELKKKIRVLKKHQKLFEFLRSNWQKGNREDLALFTAGLLRKNGLEKNETLFLVEGLCKVCDDEEMGMRLQAVRDTYRKDLNEIAGASKLLEIFGEEVKPFLKPIEGEKITNQEGNLQLSTIAKIIMQRNTFKTLKDTGEIYFYSKKEGIFKNEGNIAAKEMCQKIFTDAHLEEKLRENHVKEIRGHIERCTYTNRDVFDRDINLIAVKNGVLNIKTGEFSSFNPDYNLTVKVPVTYSPNADCPKIKQFFSQILTENDIPIIEELFGYCLSKDYRIQKAFMLMGDGANGKSTLLRLLRRILSEKNCSALSIQEIARSRFASAHLFGKLANICPDIPSDALSSTGIFKTLTGGDSVKAEKKFKSLFEFENYAKLIFSCNQIPRANDETGAFFRRWIILNFPNKFENKKADTMLVEKLATEEELSGLLNLALKGLERLMTQGEFSSSKSTEEIKEQYLRASDPIAAFVMDCIEMNSESYVIKKELYSSYCAYCRNENLPAVTENTFHGRLQKHITVIDYKPEIDKKRRTAWKGIKLKEEKSTNGVTSE